MKGCWILGHRQPLQYAFDEAAQELFDEWNAELEDKIRGGTLHPALVSHLSKHRSLMPALSLVFELADNGSEHTILFHARQAAGWCDFAESHAKRIYSLVVSPQLRAADELGRHLREGWKREEGQFTAREVCIKGWRGLDTAERVRGALDTLIDADWIGPLDSRRRSAGGRPRDEYAINPRLRRCPGAAKQMADLDAEIPK